MAWIQLNPENNWMPARSAVGNDFVRLRVDGGWILTGLTNSDTRKYSDIQQTYSFNFPPYNITIKGASNNTGSINTVLYGLAKGAKNTITVNITYSYWVSERQSQEEEWGNWKLERNSGQNEGSLDVYTRNDKIPSDFWGNPQPGDYIDEHITQNNVNDWFDQFGIWKSWREQNYYYDYFDLWKNPTGDISEAWYNALSKECGGSYRVSQFNEYISAEHFQDLARKVTDWS